MRTLLRQRESGRYFQRPGSWTGEAEAATDFRSVSRAIEVVEREGYRDLEVVFLFEEPRRMSSVPVDELMASGTYRPSVRCFRKGGNHEPSERPKDGTEGERGKPD